MLRGLPLGDINSVLRVKDGFGKMNEKGLRKGKAFTVKQKDPAKAKLSQKSKKTSLMRDPFAWQGWRVDRLHMQAIDLSTA